MCNLRKQLEKRVRKPEIRSPVEGKMLNFVVFAKEKIKHKLCKEAMIYSIKQINVWKSAKSAIISTTIITTRKQLIRRLPAQGGLQW